MTTETEDEDLMELRNNLLASMRSTNIVESNRSISSSKESRSQVEVFDTDINDLDALRDAALRTLKKSESVQKSTGKFYQSKQRGEFSAGVRLRPSHTCLQFPSVKPRFSYHSRVRPQARSNLIVIEPVSNEEHRESFGNTLTLPQDRYSSSGQHHNAKPERKHTDKWTRNHRESETSTSDTDEEEKGEKSDEDISPYNSGAEWSEEESKGRDGIGRGAKKSSVFQGVPETAEEQKEGEFDEKPPADSIEGSRSSSPDSVADERPVESSTQFDGKDLKSEQVAGSSLKVDVPAEKTSPSRSLDEEMLLLDEESGTNMIEFLEEDPANFSSIVTDAEFKSVDRAADTEDKKNAPAEGNSPAIRERLRSELATVEKQLRTIYGSRSDQESSRSFSVHKDERKERRRKNVERERAKCWSGKSEQRLPSYVSVAKVERSPEKQEKRFKESDFRRETGFRGRKFGGEDKEKKLNYSKHQPSVKTVNELARNFTTAARPLMDIKFHMRQSSKLVENATVIANKSSEEETYWSSNRKSPWKGTKTPRKPSDLREILQLRKADSCSSSETLAVSKEAPETCDLNILPPSTDLHESSRQIIRLNKTRSSSSGPAESKASHASPEKSGSGHRSKTSPIRPPPAEISKKLKFSSVRAVGGQGGRIFKGNRRQRGQNRRQNRANLGLLVNCKPDLAVEDGEVHRRVIVTSGNSGLARNQGSFIRNTGRIRLKK